MIKGNDRLIIVLGMAHSGTTILAYVLKMHPDIECHINGPEAWLLENEWLKNKDAEPIQEILNNSDKRILLKRPWMEVWNGQWMREEMPDAKFIYCHRDFDAVSVSWTKPTSQIGDDLRYGGIEHQREFYDFCFNKGNEFGNQVNNFYWHRHEHFATMPKIVIHKVAKWLELRRWVFDTTMVGKSNVKDILKPIEV
jgi:hypothetical protein